MSIQRLEKMVAELNQHEDIQIKYKNESSFMKLLGKLAFFNPDFMTKYTTVIGDTIYFPNREGLEAYSRSQLVTVAHEYQHIKDASKMSFPLFVMFYFSPQALAPFMLFFCFLYWWLGLLLFALILAPLPAVARMVIERRGYIMSLFAHNELLLERGFDSEARKELLLARVSNYNKQFTTSAYYFMWPFGVSKTLSRAVNKIIDGTILEKNKSFVEVKNALESSRQ